MDDKNSVSDEERRQFEEQLNQASKKVGNASQDIANAAQSTTQGMDRSVAGLSALGGGLVQFSNGLLNSQGNLGKVGQSADAAGSAIGDTLMMLGPFGFVIGALIKVISKVVGVVLGTDQKLLDNYDKLADLGGQTQFTTNKLRKLSEEIGQPLNGEYFDKLVDTTKTLGSTLLTLGKTSGQGMEAFMQVAKYSQTTANELNRLGINSEKYTQIQADYLTMQSKLGLQRGKDVTTLAKESKAYAQNLVELAAVTGLSTDATRKKQQQEMENFAWNVKMREMSTTDEGKKRAEMLNDMIVQMRELGGDLDADALKDILSNGFATTDAANKMITRVSSAGGNYIQWVEQLRKDGDYETFLMKIQDANQKSLDRLGTATKASADAQDSTGQSIQMVNNLSKRLEKGVRKQVHQDTENAKKGRGDDLKELQNASNQASRQMNSAIDTLASLLSGPVNRALEALTYAFKGLTQGFLEFLARWFPDSVDPALPYLFDTQEELAAKIKESGKGIAEAQAKIAKEKSKKTGYDAQAVLMAQDKISALQLKNVGLLKAAKIQGLKIDQDDKKKEQDKQKQEDEKQPKEQKLPDEVDKKTEKSKTVIEQEVKGPEAADAQSTAPAAPAVQAAKSASAKPPPVTRFRDKSGDNKAALPNTDKPKTGSGKNESLGGGYKLGGIASGPESGYNELLHGMEAIVPLPSGMNIPVSFKDLPTDISPKRDTLLTHTDELTSILENYMENLSAKIEMSNKTEPVIQKQPKITPALLELVSSKMDTLLDRMKENTNLQSELLEISKA